MFRRRHLEDGPAVWRIEIGRADSAISAGQIVGEVAHRHTGTLEVMREMGINHCCGAQLTLAEAAAAAGVPIDALLRALNETQGASL
jgi:regulator of cell morphogenesis and NO signaling